MGLLALCNHALNFLAPALWLALWVPPVAGFVIKNKAPAPVWWAQAAIQFVACAVVLMAGLVVFGRDGKMATYGAMVLVGATTQWALLQGWKA